MIEGLSCTKDIDDHIDNRAELTKISINQVVVREEVLESETDR